VRHVLIIEDEPFLAIDLQTMLEAEGVTSFSFADSEAGAIASAIDHRPSLITSDVKLLEGNGPHAVTMIQERLGTIPVIFVTASPEDCLPCEPPGRILCKPVDRAQFHQAFQDLIGEDED
jgi:CheY-like chemotaxis protein